jgi:hypothetical protein
MSSGLDRRRGLVSNGTPALGMRGAFWFQAAALAVIGSILSSFLPISRLATSTS